MYVFRKKLVHLLISSEGLKMYYRVTWANDVLGFTAHWRFNMDKMWFSVLTVKRGR